jgi:hypothetical protein
MALSLLEYGVMRKHVVSPNSKTVCIEIDRGSTTAKQATDGRIWLVRLRREGTAVIVNSRLSRSSAEHLARQIMGILGIPDAGFQGGTAMATKTIIEDDFDGSPNAQTVKYSFEGQDYEIDLSDANLEKFREVLQPYIAKSRKRQPEPILELVPSPSSRGRRRGSGGGGASSGGRTDLAEIREWANKNGYKVAERGRIAQKIIDDYDEAHK